MLIPKKVLGPLIIYDRIPLNLRIDLTMPPHPAHLLHRNLIEPFPSQTSIGHRRLNMRKMEGILIQHERIVSLSHHPNLAGRLLRHLMLGCADRVQDLRHCMTLRLLALHHHCLEGQTLYTTIHHRSLPNLSLSLNLNPTSTIDQTGNPGLLLLELRVIETFHLPIVDLNDYRMNALLILKDGFLFLAGMILEIRLALPECLKQQRFSDPSKMRIPMIRPDRRIGQPSWVI